MEFEINSFSVALKWIGKGAIKVNSSRPKKGIELSDFRRRFRGKTCFQNEWRLTKSGMKFPEKIDNVKFWTSAVWLFSAPIHHLDDGILYEHKIHNRRFFKGLTEYIENGMFSSNYVLEKKKKKLHTT